MSTFDTMCDWREDGLPDAIALLECLRNLKAWCPVAGEQEAYSALVEIARAMQNMGSIGELDYNSATFEYQRGHVPANYPMPAIRICIWCGLNCMNCPLHELKCLGQNLSCNKLHLFQ